ncbi:MAG TPA: ribonuclease R [Salinivirgaceae bacterium]|nr:ribonuclease R [Salinivirgaceae bacterium]
MSKSKKTSKHNQNISSAEIYDRILKFLNDNVGKSYNYKQIGRAIGLWEGQYRDKIVEILESLVKSSLVEYQDRGKYIVKIKEREVEGIIQIPRRGPATLVTDQGEEFSVPYSNLNKSLPGDRVKAFVYAGHKYKAPEVEIIQIIKRAKENFVGVIEVSQNFAFLVPDNNALPVDIFIPKEEVLRTKAKSGQKVVVKIKDWPENAHNPIGEIVKVLGQPGEHNVEMHAILYEFNLPYEFPPKVEKEANAIPEEIPEEEIARRRDFRNVLTFTIDPEDAKDFDDAISIQKTEKGLWEIGVHIADVTHYVKPGSELDKEAFARATSVYLVDRVVPMLPERLSNGICSLQPNTDKLTYSAVFTMTDNAEVVDYWIGRTIINSNRRFTYDEAQERIERGEGDLSQELNICHRLAQILRKNRLASGAINFERSEVKFKLDEKGAPIGVYLKESKEANQLIEEFMLLANRYIAQHILVLSRDGQLKTFVYRVHDKPNLEKLARFARFIQRFGQKIDITDNISLSRSINTLLDNSQGTAWQNVVETLAVRTMARAEYSAKNIGHYGLAFDHYTHFTSPIRRYPDMMVHRLLTRYMEGQKSLSFKQVDDECKHCSEREVLATSAERASIKYKQVEYLKDRIGEEFDGVISGVTNWGLYVELEGNASEGIVSLQTLHDDYYIFDEDEYCLIGQRNRKVFRLGDTVRIRVVNANLLKKQLDFEMIENFTQHKKSDFDHINTNVSRGEKLTGRKPKNKISKIKEKSRKRRR